METGCCWNSVEECLPTKSKALDLSPNTEKKKKKNSNKNADLQKCLLTDTSQAHWPNYRFIQTEWPRKRSCWVGDANISCHIPPIHADRASARFRGLWYSAFLTFFL